MADFYGGKSAEAPKPEFGEAKITLVDTGGKLFQDAQKVKRFGESHNDEVVNLPQGPTSPHIADSCKVQAMENDKSNRFYNYNFTQK